MGYYANGSGTITVARDTPKELIERITETFETDISGGVADGTTDINVWADGKYYDDDIIDTLDLITPYTMYGEIQYIGEDESIWQFYFDEKKKKWDCENGEIVFPHCVKSMSPDLLREAAWEYETQSRTDDLLNSIEENFDIPESQRQDLAEKALSYFEKYLSNNEMYWDAYWATARFAIEEVLSENN